MVAQRIDGCRIVTKSKKQAPRFGLNMDPDEFLERAIRTKPSEVDTLAKRGKQKKPPGNRKPSGGRSSQPETVVDLRHRRMRKRNEGR
jgi:hypothetical protein